MLHSSGGGALTRPPTRRQPPIQSRRTSQKLPCHCEGVSPWQSVTPAAQRAARPRRGRKDADCHVASLLAMTAVDDGWSFCFSAFIIVPGRRGQCRTPYSLPPRRTPFPTPRIPYAERKLATSRAVSARLMARTIYQSRIGTGTAGRAVLLDCRQAKFTRHEFGSGHCPARPHEFCSSADKQNVRQLITGHCPVHRLFTGKIELCVAWFGNL